MRRKWLCSVCILLAVMIVAPSVARAFESAPIIKLPINTILDVLSRGRSIYAVPLYRLKGSKPVEGGGSLFYHRYTTSEAERTQLKNQGYFDDGIVTYIAPCQVAYFGVPLRRFTCTNGLPRFDLLRPSICPTGYYWSGDLGFVSPLELPSPVWQKVCLATRPIAAGKGVTSSDHFYGVVEGGVFKYPDGYEFKGPMFSGYAERVLLQQVTLNTITSPITGGTQLALDWQTRMSGGVIELLYSMDNGASWSTIASGISNQYDAEARQPATYSWRVPNYATEEMRIMVRWTPSSGSAVQAWATTPKLTVTRNLRLTVASLTGMVSVLSTKPLSPTELAALPGTATPQISLFWSDNAYNETEYVVYWWLKDSPLSRSTIKLPANATTWVHTGVTPDVAYAYEVMTRNTQDSGKSNEATATYVASGNISLRSAPMPELLSPPTSLAGTLVPGSPPVVRLDWTKPSGTVLGYAIEKRGSGSWEELTRVFEPEASTYTDNDASVGSPQQLSYRVSAIGPIVNSAPSNVATVQLASTPPPAPGPVPGTPTYDGSQSEWAQAEITQAFQLGLTYPGVMYEYQRKITREEFCTVAVKLYEKLSGKAAVAGEDPFGDTDNPDVLKALALGIVRGVSAAQFAPSSNITRQEMCVMIYRALQAAGENTLLVPGGEFAFGDSGEIAAWAVNEVRFCYQKQIMKGTSPTTISPLVNTPREQAIVLIFRTYQAFK